MADAAMQRKFSEALDALVGQIQQDRSVLAAILCGSLSHDQVWAKSDIDLLLVTIDDKKVEAGHRALYADGLNVHAMLMPRASFRTLVEGAVQQSFMHSFMTKGRLLYTHDESIAGLFATLEAARAGRSASTTRSCSCWAPAAGVLGPLDKAHKWFITRGDLEYSSLYILYAATPLAQIEVLDARKLVDREVIPQALALNPPFFKTIYVDLLNNKKTAKASAGGARRHRSLSRRSVRRGCSRPCSNYLRETGDTRSATDIDHHFSRTHGIECVSARLRVSGRSRPDRQGGHHDSAHEEEQRRRCRSWRFFTSSGRTRSRRNRDAMAVKNLKARAEERAAHDHRSPRRARPQPEEHLGRDPARSADRRHRALRLRQIQPRVRHDLRRRPAALHGVAVVVREAVRRAGRQARRRFRVRPVAGDLDRAEDHRQQSALHRRHDDRHLQLSARCSSQRWARRIARGRASRVPTRTAIQILEAILSLPEGTEVELRAPVFKIYGEDLDVVFTEVRKKGIRRLIVDGKPIDIAENVELDETDGPRHGRRRRSRRSSAARTRRRSRPRSPRRCSSATA